MGAKSLGRIASDFIGAALLFREAPEENRLDASAMRSHMLALLDAFMRHPFSQSVPDEADEARFALVALADEMMIVSGWAQSEQWLKDSLQLALYQTNRAGDEFYDHLHALRPHQNLAREVYYLCMALGFEGQYAGRGAERAELMRHHYDMLRTAQMTLDVAVARPIAPPAYEVGIEITAGAGRRMWPVFLGWLLSIGFVFGICWAWLYYMSSQVPLPPDFLR